MKRLGECGSPADQSQGGGSGGGWLLDSKPLSWGALALLIVALPLAPTLWRRRVRGRRLSASGGRTHGTPPTAPWPRGRNSPTPHGTSASFRTIP
ncbi:hypothetical protein NKH77_14205 [Streptomyces sp. M19]